MAGVGSLMTGEHVSVGDNIQTAFELELEQAKLQRTLSALLLSHPFGCYCCPIPDVEYD